MKFIINSQNFSRQLQAVSGVLTTNNTIPIISCFHFHINGDILTVTATDLETTIRTDIQLESGRAEGIEDVCVPSRILLDTLKSMDDVPMTFTVDSATFSIEIVSGDGKFQLAGQSAETYPTLPELESTLTLTIPSVALMEAVGKTSFACSTDEMRQQMSGIYFTFGPNYMTTVATDAHKLVRYRRRDVKSDSDASFIMPRKPILLVKNTLANSKEETVEMNCNATNASFRFGSTYVICRLVEGKYPNTDAAIPKENPDKLTLDRVSFLNTLRRVGLFASQSTHQVRLSLSANELTIGAEDIEFSNKAQEKMPCIYEGEDMEIGFNAKFLIEMVNNIDTENIRIEMSHPSRAGILFPVFDSDEPREDEILMLVMPVMLSN